MGSQSPKVASVFALVMGGGGGVILRVDVILVLAMFVEFNGGNVTALRKIIAKQDNAFRLVRRIANRHRGMKEANLLSLITAFVLCHFTYTISMHNWLRAERDKLNALIRKRERGK